MPSSSRDHWQKYFTVYSLTERGAIQELKEHLRDGNASAQICALLGPACRTLIIEHEYRDIDYTAGYRRIYHRRHRVAARWCDRLHFFARALTTAEVDDLQNGLPKELSSSYLGFIVRRPLQGAELGRSVFSTVLFRNDEHPTCAAEFRVNLAGQQISLQGIPWLAQDGIVGACATAALKTATDVLAHRYPENFRQYAMADITDFAGQHYTEQGRAMPSEGLTSSEIILALKTMGYETITRSCFRSVSQAVQLIRLSIESGFPAIISMSRAEDVDSHVAVVVGWVGATEDDGPYADRFPKGSIIQAEHSSPCFLLQDDDRGPLLHLRLAELAVSDQRAGKAPNGQRLSADAISQTKIRVHLTDRVSNHDLVGAPDAESCGPTTLDFVILFCPPHLLLDGPDAESRAVRLVKAVTAEANSGISWDGAYTARTFLELSNTFKNRVAAGSLTSRLTASWILSHPMPKWIWVTELTIQDGHQRRLIGHVIQDTATHAPGDQDSDDSCVFWHLFGRLAAYDVNGDATVAQIPDFSLVPIRN